MKRNYLLVILLLISSLIYAKDGGMKMGKYSDQIPVSGRGSSQVEYQGKSIDKMIYDFMSEKGIPGMTLAIVQAPYIPRIVGYGVTDLDNGNLAAVKTIWPAGPISQGYAAVATIQLYEKGKLNINDPISKYIKSLPDSWKNISVIQLMQHSTGIADYRSAEDFDYSKAYDESQLLKMVWDKPLAFVPGTDVEVSATNFLLLTSVIEKASGMKYKDFVKKYQIDFIGLTETKFGSELNDVKQEKVAPGAVHTLFKLQKEYIDAAETTTGYRDKDGMLVPTAPLNGDTMKGFSDIWASAGNISTWDIALAGSVFIAKPENRALIYSPTTLANGKVVPAMAGWEFFNHKGLMDIKGNSPGHSSFLSRFTDASELVCVTLLANKEGVDLTNLARRIAAAFDGAKMGTGANDNYLYNYESQFCVGETMGKLEDALKKKCIPVFAKFNHEKNAAEVGLKMLPNQVIVFGSPKVGTLLMQQNPSISIELPLKISVWEDAKRSVWISFPSMYNMAEEFNMEQNPIIDNMETLLENLTTRAANVYYQLILNQY